ncbi:MarR family transcriptional regulator [Streptosporangium nondiastaticum]
MTMDGVRGSAPATEMLAGTTGWLLHEAARRVVAETEEALRGEGLRWRDYGVLGLLQAAGPLSQQEIGRRLGVDRSTMVHLIDALEERGLVDRARDPADRRAYAVRLTGAGHALLADVLRPVTETVHDRLLGGLTAEDRAHLDRVLAHLAVQGVIG